MIKLAGIAKRIERINKHALLTKDRKKIHSPMKTNRKKIIDKRLHVSLKSIIKEFKKNPSH